MRRILIVLLLLLPVSLFAQSSDIHGVYFGATFRQTLELKNSILQAGYLLDLGKGMYGSVGLDYDRAFDIYSVQPNVFYKLKDRIFVNAGIGADFHNTDFNNTAQLSLGFAYVPDFKLFNTMELAFVANMQYTGWIGFGSAAELGERPVVVDNKTSGAELWISIIMLGV